MPCDYNNFASYNFAFSMHFKECRVSQNCISVPIFNHAHWERYINSPKCNRPTRYFRKFPQA